jgi:hypothetical protein
MACSENVNIDAMNPASGIPAMPGFRVGVFSSSSCWPWWTAGPTADQAASLLCDNGQHGRNVVGEVITGMVAGRAGDDPASARDAPKHSAALSRAKVTA